MTSLIGCSWHVYCQRWWCLVVAVSVPSLLAVLAALERSGDVVRGGPLWFSRDAFDELVLKVRAHFEKADTLSVADFKAITGLGRKQSIPLLEVLDREKVTKRPRDGSDRVPG